MSRLSTEQILMMLASGPAQIAEYTAALTESELQAAPGSDEWSANQVLAHLRSCSDVWGNCIMTIIHEDTPTIRAINPRTWIQSTDYHEQKFRPSLRAFTAQRNKLSTVLKSIPPEFWSRSAIITGAGKPLERTVLFYAQWMAEHERPHLKQIKRLVSTLR